jgi:hypothetical protein
MAPRHACFVGLLLAAVLLSPASAAITGRQQPDTLGETAVTDPALSRALEDARAAAGKPRLFHKNLVKDRPLVQPAKW